MSSSSKQEIDYSLYLVTARELLPPGKVGTAARSISRREVTEAPHMQDYYESLEEVGQLLFVYSAPDTATRSPSEAE